MFDKERGRAFFDEGRIAFVGLSAKKDSFSRMVARELDQRGIEVLAVNPHEIEVAGHRSYPRVSDIKDPPKAALLMVPAREALAVVRDCVHADVHKVWFHRGVGAPGSASPEAVELARSAGLEVITDACPMMALEPVGWLHRTHRWLRDHSPEEKHAA